MADSNIIKIAINNSLLVSAFFMLIKEQNKNSGNPFQNTYENGILTLVEEQIPIYNKAYGMLELINYGRKLNFTDNSQLDLYIKLLDTKLSVKYKKDILESGYEIISDTNERILGIRSQNIFCYDYLHPEFSSLVDESLLLYNKLNPIILGTEPEVKYSDNLSTVEAYSVIDSLKQCDSALSLIIHEVDNRKLVFIANSKNEIIFLFNEDTKSNKLVGSSFIDLDKIPLSAKFDRKICHTLGIKDKFSFIDLATGRQIEKGQRNFNSLN